MDANSRVPKAATRKRQPQKTKKTTPIRRSERVRQRLEQEKKVEDTQFQALTAGKPSRQKQKQQHSAQKNKAQDTQVQAPAVRKASVKKRKQQHLTQEEKTQDTQVKASAFRELSAQERKEFWIRAQRCLARPKTQQPPSSKKTDSSDHLTEKVRRARIPAIWDTSDEKREEYRELYRRLLPRKKRPQPPSSRTADSADEDDSESESESESVERSAQEDENTDNTDAIDYWRKHLHWPPWFLMAKGTMFGGWLKVSEQQARSKTTKSKADSNVPRSVIYGKADYERFLQRLGIFMRPHITDIPEEAQQQCLDLCKRDEPVPANTLFDNEIFTAACEMLRNRNEYRIVRDMTLLLVPSAEILELRQPRDERIFAESANEAWECTFPITFPRPQPDFAAGFREEAFSEDQLERLKRFLGEVEQESYFKTTSYMLFPFLTCEVKCGEASLQVADRQNAHSAAVAVRSVVELFRLVHREKELDRQILAFSVSHDNSVVRIYGHYAAIVGRDQGYYRHEIDRFDFVAKRGERKWDTYKFTRNIYEKWAPNHLKRLHALIDTIPYDLKSDPPSRATQSQDCTDKSHVPSTRSRLSEVQNADDIEDNKDEDNKDGDEEYMANYNDKDTDVDGGGPRRSKRIRTK